VADAPQPPKGRGSAHAMPHRFVPLQREAADDGWQPCEGEDASAPDAASAAAAPVPTQWRWEVARSALTRNRSPDVPFELSLNPYRGCEHGCAYCFARPTHAYLDLSPLDFKAGGRNIAELLSLNSSTALPTCRAGMGGPTPTSRWSGAWV
jgi:hypothetical protein